MSNASKFNEECASEAFYAIKHAVREIGMNFPNDEAVGLIKHKIRAFYGGKDIHALAEMPEDQALIRIINKFVSDIVGWEKQVNSYEL